MMDTRRSQLVSCFTTILPVLALVGGTALAAEHPLDKSNVVWDSPSHNCDGSMPIGNGDIGLNVWVEEDGDLLFYIGKTDAWSECERLLKLARVRVSLWPNPFTQGMPFRQTLDLREGRITIIAGPTESAVTLQVWVDANRPVIHIESSSIATHQISARLERWRTERRVISNDSQELFSCPNVRDWEAFQNPIPLIVTPDVLHAGVTNQVVWYHRNETSTWLASMKHQGLDAVASQFKDPLLHRTFGGAIWGDGFTKGAGYAKMPDNGVLSEKETAHYLRVACLTQITDTPEQWLAEVQRIVGEADACGLESARREHQRWWHAFWERSWIRVSGSPDAEQVSQAYVLQRWINACGGRGAFPIKFNGSVFTVDARISPTEMFDADYRAWGGPYWWQNTRLPYWTMLASGDFDFMRPLFNFYRGNMELCRQRARIYHNVSGVYFPETMTIAGLYCDGSYGYGWHRQGMNVASIANESTANIWYQGLELAMMMLDYYEHTGDDRFLKEELLPLAEQVLLYFDTRFARDASGKLVISPAQVCESHQGSINPLPEVAGLHAVLSRLLALPNSLVDVDMRSRWRKLEQTLPPLPLGEKDGQPCIVAAGRIVGGPNIETPELYAVFPFRLYGLGHPNLDVALNSYQSLPPVQANVTVGWSQKSIQAARLGLTEDARSILVTNVKNKHERSRFPAFWGPNFDWIPDQCHGSNIINTLQSMVLQSDGRHILVLPAWPKDWNVDFKLHAAYNTTVEGAYQDGEIERLATMPDLRGKDVWRSGEGQLIKP